MKPKVYFWSVLFLSLILIGFQILVNYYIDLYGLFRDSKGRSISLYSDERTSKYLLAYNYIPSNFEALWIGPSLSANINTKLIPGPRIYNLSMMGANITEQRIVAEKVMEKANLKFAIICLHPYLTMDHGLKTGMINPKEYNGAMGSVSLYKGYTMRFIRENELLPEKFPKDQFNDFGYNNYNDLYGSDDVKGTIAKELMSMKTEPVPLDSAALEELAKLCSAFQSKGTKVYGYFHPLPFEIMEKNRKNYQVYEQTIRQSLPGVTIADFNTSQYDSFTKDYSNFIDHGHLSYRGQLKLIRQIQDVFFRGIQ